MTNSLTVLRPRNRPPVSGRTLSASLPDGLTRMLEDAEAALAQPFVGITTDGKPVPGLFALQQTGSPTAPIRQAAEAFLSATRHRSRERRPFSHWIAMPGGAGAISTPSSCAMACC